PGIKPVGVKWVYKLKSSTKARFKARLVALGYVQRPGIDFLETYAPVVKVSSLRILLSIVASLDLEIAQFDVSSAFLNGTLKETVYIKQAPGFDDKTGRICKLNKGLYGLHQSPRAWNEKFNEVLLKA